MFNKLFQIFKDNKEFCPINAMSGITKLIDEIDQFLLERCDKDSSLSKNAALDAICEILQAHKDK